MRALIMRRAPRGGHHITDLHAMHYNAKEASVISRCDDWTILAPAVATYKFESKTRICSQLQPIAIVMLQHHTFTIHKADYSESLHRSLSPMTRECVACCHYIIGFCPLRGTFRPILEYIPFQSLPFACRNPLTHCTCSLSSAVGASAPVDSAEIGYLAFAIHSQLWNPHSLCSGTTHKDQTGGSCGICSPSFQRALHTVMRQSWSTHCNVRLTSS